MNLRSRLFRPGRLLLALACLASLGLRGAPAVDKEAIKKGLLEHLTHLSVTLGERCIYRPANLLAAEAYVFYTLARMGYSPRRQTFIYQGVEVSNVVAGEAHRGGYYLLGAHFDSVAGSPGADDNASGVAVLLEVARLTAGEKPPRPWVFAGFTTEEPPAYFTPYMGSRVYARQAKKEGHHILGMICLESVGYFSHESHSQTMPIYLRLMGYSTTGNYIGIVSDWRSRPLMRGLEAACKAAARLPVESLAVPLGGHLLPEVRLSDHANFWDQGYPAVMVTDTAFFRNPHYHTDRDRLETLDLDAMVELTLGLAHFVRQAE